MHPEGALSIRNLYWTPMLFKISWSLNNEILQKKGLKTNLVTILGGYLGCLFHSFLYLILPNPCNQTDLQVIIHILENKITSKLSNNSLK